MGNYTFPDNYDSAGCVIIAINQSLVPFVAGALKPFEHRTTWASDNDYERGYNAFVQLQADMANNCLIELVESNNRLYRLLDSALNGTVYSASGDEPPVVTPAIPAAPPADVGELPGLRRQLLELQGMTPGGWFGIGSRPATLADIAAAMRAGSEGEVERVLGVLDVLQAGSSAATIFNAVREFFADGAEITAEGLMLATLIASSMANAAMMGLQGAQLDNLIAKLERVIEQIGVPVEPAPADTVAGELAAIRDNLTP